jgi:predicted nucleic acid-binding protein
MEPFVLDASVTLPWCLDDQANAYTEAILDWCAAGTDAFVASVWPLEITNILIQAQRKGRVDEQRIDQFMEVLLRLPIHIEPHSAEQSLREVRKLAAAHRLTSYDAAYLSVALQRSLPLATQDADLRRAALAAGVRLVEP